MSAEKTLLLHIPVSNIEDNPNALRKVDVEDPDFEKLVDSVKSVGVLQAILVMSAVDAHGNPKTDDKGNPVYRLIDGLHRLTAAREAGQDTIPAQVVKTSEAQAMADQLITNVHKIETKPWQYSQHLTRILMRDQTLTIPELADKLSMDAAWLNKRLGLVHLAPEIGKLVDDESITVTNAVELAKLPPNEQKEFAERAASESPQTFVNAVKERLKQLRAAKREGRKPGEVTFVATPYLRKPAEVKAAYEKPDFVAEFIKAQGIADPVEAASAVLKWVVHMDEASIAEARAKFEADRAKKKAENERKKLEAAKKRGDEAKAKLAAAGVDADADSSE
jgi:ParB/RepB/Spo0J family partition protein